MNTYHFKLELDRVPSDAETDALYEGGLDDAAVQANHRNGAARLVCAREAASMSEALYSAIRQAESVGLEIIGVASEDTVTIPEIAAKIGRTPQSVRLLASGKRGPGGFPAGKTLGRYTFYSWNEVGKWLGKHYELPYDDDAATIAAADLLIRARAMADISALAPLINV